MKNIKINLFLGFFLLLFSACEDENSKTYNVGAEFQDYVNRFEKHGSRHGYDFDLENNGLIIVFADLKNDVAGLCHHEKPIRIEIDRTYWEKISQSSNADLLKEDLLFHEMGHGLLDRRHINDLLENGDWKSMMCGGDMVNNRPWNINYAGERREYYINELFNQNTSAPEIASLNFLKDLSVFSLSYHYTFDTKDESYFNVDKNDKMSIDNKMLRIDSNQDLTSFMVGRSVIDLSSDFIFESTFYYPKTNSDQQYGLVFGGEEKDNSTLTEYQIISNNQKYSMGNSKNHSFYTEIASKEIKSDGNVNKIKLAKLKNKLYCFINDKYIYCTEIDDPPVNLHYLGFAIPPNSSIWIDDLKLYTRNMAFNSRLKSPSEHHQLEVIKTGIINLKKVGNQ